MGTNYYWHEGICSECGATKGETIHIGKSSGGWCFSLHVERGEGPQNLDDYIALFKKQGGAIRDECQRSIGPEEMIGIITDRSSPRKSSWSTQEYNDNNAEKGPNGLVRFRVDGRHCIGHGEGTWDYITGDFS